MSSPSKEESGPRTAALTKRISRIYRVLASLKTRLSGWHKEAIHLLAEYGRTGDARDLEAFDLHISGELARLREALSEVGL
jgi:hypothetical protein